MPKRKLRIQHRWLNDRSRILTDTFVTTVIGNLACTLEEAPSDPLTLVYGTNRWQLNFTYIITGEPIKAMFTPNLIMPDGLQVAIDVLPEAETTAGTYQGQMTGTVTVPVGYVGDGTIEIRLDLMIMN